MKEGLQRRRYAREFKEEVIALLHSSEKSIAEVCRDLGLPETTVQRWLHEFQVDSGRRAGITTPERDELSRLRREVRDLREERVILKKAMAFFARETR